MGIGALDQSSFTSVTGSLANWVKLRQIDMNKLRQFTSYSTLCHLQQPLRSLSKPHVRVLCASSFTRLKGLTSYDAVLALACMALLRCVNQLKDVWSAPYRSRTVNNSSGGSCLDDSRPMAPMGRKLFRFRDVACVCVVCTMYSVGKVEQSRSQ